MFLSGFTQALEINTSTSTTILNTCEQINMAGYMLNTGGNVEEIKDYGFASFIFHIKPYHYK